MITLLALIFAASLTSSDIGEFFTLADWIPDEVASADTPGSDPSIGQGWYVELVTNGVTKTDEWVCRAVGIDNPLSSTIGYDGQYWHFEQVASEAFEILVPEYIGGEGPFNYLKLGSQDDDVLNQVVTYYYITSESPTDPIRIDIDLTAIRVLSTNEVHTGEYRPRSPRLTPEIQAGVLSTFAAYSERQYYAPQGQTNLWDTSVYGSAINKRRFVFNPLGEDYPDGEFAFEPTNRIVRTRRLVNYDNIDNLADTLKTDLCTGNNFVYSHPSRPSWINVENDQRFWWSTTNPIIPDSKIIPTFAWTSNPLGYNWSNSSITFERLGSDPVWTMYATAEPMQPVIDLMLSVDMGETSWQTRVINNCSQDVLDLTMSDVISTVYPHADPHAITNDTRRLLSERLCCANQVLGLMDRTFQVPSVYYPTNYVFYQFDRDARSHGTASSHLAEWDAGRKQYIIRVDSQISWEWLRYSTNVVSVSTNAYASYIGMVRHAASETGSATGVTTQAPATDEEFEGERTFGYRLGETDLRLICNGWEDGTWYITFYDYLPNVLDDQSFDLKYSYFKEDSDIFRGWYTVTPTGDVQHVSFDYNYSRHYNYSHPFESPHLGPHQPGFQSRNTTSNYGMVTATSFGAIDHLSIPHVTNRMYRAKTGEFVGRGGAEVIVSDEAEGMNERFQTLYGYNPLNYNQIIPMIASDISESRNSTAITNIYMKAVCYLSSTNTQNACVTISGGRITSIDTGTLGTVVSLNYVSDDKSYDRPKSEDHDGMVLNAKIGILTRTDWDWKALKRTDD